MKSQELEIAGRKLTCNISYKLIRHAYLRIRPDYQIDIALPRNGTISAESMLESKRRWIERKVKELSKVKKIYYDHRVLYLGEYVQIEVYPADGNNKNIRLLNGTLSIFGRSDRDNQKMLADFLSCQTLWYARQKAGEFIAELGVMYTGMTAKKMKKWGYCTRKGNIVFNNQLICLPQRLIDYIVFHELLHLKHFNHLKRFKNAMANHFADHKELDAELKTYIS
jgi:predicted metal-dependent hydrolase